MHAGSLLAVASVLYGIAMALKSHAETSDRPDTYGAKWQGWSLKASVVTGRKVMACQCSANVIAAQAESVLENQETRGAGI